MGGTALPEGGGKKAKRALDATVNVVPAIDLLSCCISFLLFTAVWTQIGRLQATPMGDGTVPGEVQPAKALTVTLTVGERGYVLATSTGGPMEIPVTGKTKDG
ncbi:MAG TPA: biopolymer transporter ExbD, partial [Anaeromyxobacteraceae bacterium]